MTVGRLYTSRMGRSVRREHVANEIPGPKIGVVVQGAPRRAKVHVRKTNVAGTAVEWPLTGGHHEARTAAADAAPPRFCVPVHRAVPGPCHHVPAQSARMARRARHRVSDVVHPRDRRTHLAGAAADPWAAKGRGDERPHRGIRRPRRKHLRRHRRSPGARFVTRRGAAHAAGGHPAGAPRDHHSGDVYIVRARAVRAAWCAGAGHFGRGVIEQGASVMRSLACYAAAIAVLLVCRVDAAEITVRCSNGVREAFVELLPQFEKATGHRVIVTFDGTLNIKKRLDSGEAADLVVMPAADVDALIASGGLAPGSRVDLAKSIIGVAVRAGVAKPDLSTGESLRREMLAAKSIVISSGPSGVHLLELLEKQGILGTLRPRITQLPSGQSVGEALARGEGDLGFQQVSELLHVKGITYVGPLPADVQKVTIFSGGIPKTAQDAGLARELLTFLRNPRNAAVLKKAGLELP